MKGAVVVRTTDMEGMLDVVVGGGCEWWALKR
jgi:hypothetical protein